LLTELRSGLSFCHSGVVVRRQEASGAMQGQTPKNFSLSGKFSVKKIQIFALKILHFGERWGKIEILSTHNLACRKFLAVCRKNATSCPRYFLNPRRTPLAVSDTLDALSRCSYCCCCW